MANKKIKKLQVKAKSLKQEKKKQVSRPKAQVGGALAGLVIAARLPKTVTVLVEHRKMHPLYGKSIRRSKKYLVHDEIGVHEGDVVEMVQIRPMSKNKHFAVAKVVGQDMETIVTEQLKERAAQEIAEVLPEKVEVSEELEEAKEPAVEKPKLKKKKKGEDK